MPTGDAKINIYDKRLLSLTGIKTNFLDYLDNKIDERTSAIFQQTAGVLDSDKIDLVASGNDQFDLDLAAASRVVVGTGEIIDLSLLTGADKTTDIEFENESAIDYYVGVKFMSLEDGIELNPRSGDPEYPDLKDTYGEKDNPTSLVDDFGVDLTLNVNSIFESGVDHSGRTVKVYLVDPVSAVLATAFYEGTVVFNTPNNEIVIPYSGSDGPLGQDTGVDPPSVVTTDYIVAQEGVTWRRNSDLRTDNDYAFIGTVNGGGAGTPLTSTSTTDQIAIFINTLDRAYDGATGSGSGRTVLLDSGAIVFQSSAGPGDDDHAMFRLTRKGDTTTGQFFLELLLPDALGGQRAIPVAILAPVSTSGGEIQVDEPVALDGTSTLTFSRGGAQDLTLAAARLSDDLALVLVRSTTADDGLYFIANGTLAASALDVIDPSTGAAPSTWDATDDGIATILRPIFWISSEPLSTAHADLLKGTVHVGLDGRGNDRSIKFLPEGNSGTFLEFYDSQTPTRNVKGSTDEFGRMTLTGLRLTPDPLDAGEPSADSINIFSIEPPASTPLTITPSARMARELGASGAEIRRYEPHGRWADGHRLKEDFFYDPVVFDSGLGAGGGGQLNDTWEYFLTAAGAGNQRATIDSTLTGGPRRGGNLFLRCTDLAAAVAEARSPLIWQARESGPTDVSRLYFYARTRTPDVTNVVFAMGFATGAGSGRFYWSIDTGGTNVWTLIADDGVNPPVSVATSIASSTSEEMHLWIVVDPFDGVGKIMGRVERAGGSEDTAAIVMAGAGATHLDIHKAFYRVTTNITVEKDLLVDYTEVWDEQLHSGSPS